MPADFQALCDGDQTTIGSRQWTAPLGYAHAEGHVTLWSNDRVALVGDPILPAVAPNLSVHYCTPEEDTFAPWIESCERLATVANDRTLLQPGHGRSFYGVPLCCRQLVDNCQRVLERLEQFFVQPMTAIDCLKFRVRRSMSDYEKRLLIADTIGFLNHLLHQQRTRQHRSSSGYAHGQIYGCECTPARLSDTDFNISTFIKHLYLTGTDLTVPGVNSALMIGVMTAGKVLGWLGTAKIMSRAMRSSK